jgi:hypothetical protein
MKKFYFVLFVFFCLSVFGSINQTYAQEIYFCEGVDDDGYPIKASTNFTIPEEGGYLYVLVRLPNKVNCRTVKLLIYNEDEELENTIKIDTEKSWTWFWKKVEFYEAGEFIVDVWDCNTEYLVTGSIEIDKD